MLIDEEVYSNLKVSDFLEHHGIKGQRWGVRTKRAAEATWRGTKAFGRGTEATARVTWRGTKAFGRGAAATGRFLNKHKKVAATVSISAGAVAVGLILKKNHDIKLSQLAKNKADVETAKKFLAKRKDVRVSHLVDIANKYEPGSVTRNLALQEIHSLAK